MTVDEAGVSLGYVLIKGSDVSAEIYKETVARIEALKAKGLTPGLAVVLVGEDPASQTYVRMKGKKCEELGMKSVTIVLPADTTEDELLAKVGELNNDPSIHGFLVQLPLPKQIDEDKIINAIDPRKDVDCFHPENVGRMLIGNPIFLPATPAGVQQMLIRSNIDTCGKDIVIVGRSNIVGKPMAAMLMQKGKGGDATVTVVHSRTKNLAEMTRRADILIVAIGKPRFITADMVKEGAVVIDVGTNRIADPTHPKGSRLVGDVDFDNVKDKVSAITPVPGGVGPMTICMLMSNAVKAAEQAFGTQAQK
jgi:methylenetetrahydrofolate dehydrogenase (NADP+)/methenyltetrahydrofolate cyclohydrolase